MQENPDYMPVEEAAHILNVSTRQASRYADRIKTRRAGKRTLFLRPDVEKLAAEKQDGVAARGEAKQFAPRTPPSNDLVAYLREKDAIIERQQHQLLAAEHKIGQLEAEVALLREQLFRDTT